MSSNSNQNELKWMDLSINGLGILFVSALGFGIYYLAICPLVTQADYLENQATSVESFLENSEPLEQENQQLIQQVSMQTEQWDRLKQQIPKTPDASKFLSELTQLSNENDLKISNFSPGASRSTETCKQLQIQLSIKGTYLNLCHFISGLKSLSRVTTIENLDVTTPNQNNSDGIYSFSLNIQLAYDYQEPKVIAKL